MKKRILSIVLSLCMVFTFVPQMAYAASTSDSAPSVSAYATKAQLTDGTFAPNSDGTANNIGKLIFGKSSSGSAQEWYILGSDSKVSGDNTVIFAASPMVTGQKFDGQMSDLSQNPEGDKTLEADCTYLATAVSGIVYLNHYGDSDLRSKLKALATEKFIAAEQGMMNDTTVTTNDVRNNADYTTTDKLYAPAADGFGSNYKTIKVGSTNQKILAAESYWKDETLGFWLRSAGKNTNDSGFRDSLLSLYATPDSTVWYYIVPAEYNVRPAANLNLSDVLFASAATVERSSTDATYGTIEDGKAMSLKLDGSDKNIGSVTYSTAAGEINVKRGGTSLVVSLVVQGKDGSKDWYYSKRILGNDAVTVKSDDIKSALSLSDIDLSSCRIWLEAYSSTSDRGNGMSYAVKADEKTEKISSAYATKKQLMYSFSPHSDGTAENVGRLVFGNKQNADGKTYSPQEWFILGKDNGVSGDNTVIFAANTMKYDQRFNLSKSNTTYNGTEVYANHYGASDLRGALKSMAEDSNHFSTGEQSIMNATPVKTSDVKNGGKYTTTDKLYALTADQYGRPYHTTIKAGSADDKFLLKDTYWAGRGSFWLRAPVDDNNEKALCAFSFADLEYVTSREKVLPAGNLNLSSVLFASAAEATSGDTAACGKISSGKAMTLRLDGKNENLGRVTYDLAAGEVRAVKGSASGTVSLVVQGNDGTEDWYYSRKVTGNQTVKASEIKSALELPEDVDLSTCHIWIEKKANNGLIYAVPAKGCSTEAELLEAIESGDSSVFLTSDIKLSNKLNLRDKVITLDLNGYTLKGNIIIEDSNAEPLSKLILEDSSKSNSGVLDGSIELTRGDYGTGSYLYANGGKVTGKVSLNSYVAKIYCTSSTPTVFNGYAGNYGSIYGGIYTAAINESCIKGKTVTFMNGSSRYALEVIDGGNVYEPASPEVKTGYGSFDGWYNGDKKYTFGSSLSEDITLSAKYGNIITYNIAYNLNGGSAENPAEYTVESNDITLNNPTKKGYVFTGWSETGSDGKKNMNVTIPKGSTGDRTYTANYELKTGYAIIFNSNGGTYIPPKTTNLTLESIVLEGVADPTRAGYTFEGWKCGDTDVDDKTTYGSLAADDTVSEIQIAAQWSENIYSVSFDADGGSSVDSKNGVKWNDKVLDGVTSPEKEGYIFEGWKCGDKVVNADTACSELASSDSDNILLKAQWSEVPVPTGTITQWDGDVEKETWETYRDGVSTYRYYSSSQTIKIAANKDNESVEKEYLLSDRVLTVDELDEADFSKYTGEVELSDNQKYIVYARLTNAHGYVAYISSEAIIIDTVYPDISGITADKTYCILPKVTVTDDNIKSVTLVGEKVTKEVTLDENNQFDIFRPDDSEKVDIVATDKSGNESKITVTLSDGHKDDNKDNKCDRCGERINAFKAIKVSGITDRTYTGNAITPNPAVSLDGKKLVKGTDYELKYSKNKSVGTATVQISGKGKYEGTVTKTFKINPKGTSISKMFRGKRTVTLKWKRQSAKMASSRITGYQIRYSRSSEMTDAKMKTVKGYKHKYKKITKLKAKSKYYIQIRTYKTVSGNNYYSGWSKVRTVKIR